MPLLIVALVSLFVQFALSTPECVFLVMPLLKYVGKLQNVQAELPPSPMGLKLVPMGPQPMPAHITNIEEPDLLTGSTSASMAPVPAIADIEMLQTPMSSHANGATNKIQTLHDTAFSL
jgi:hypothetical protein